MKRVAVNLAVGAVAVLAMVLVIESTLRLFPALLPHGVYGSGRYDPDLETNVRASTLVYNKVRYVVREPNGDGFLDVDHARRRASPDQVRIAFFGDSYVESFQVPHDQVFYRLLPAYFPDRNVETFGFGISGWGMLHSYLAYRAMADRYDLDIVVYVFVENDPGDNAYSIQGGKTGRHTPKAYAELSDDDPGYSLRWDNPPGEVSVGYEIAKLLQNRFLLGQLIWNRLALLRQGGVAFRPDAANREMTGRASADEVPDQNDLPSTWPARYREEAAQLAANILRSFRDETRRRGHPFFVLYVPRGETQLTGEVREEDTWLPWLRRTCAEFEIPLLEPNEALLARLQAGDPMYDDHWTPAGHEVVASELARRLKPQIEITRAKPETPDTP